MSNKYSEANYRDAEKHYNEVLKGLKDAILFFENEKDYSMMKYVIWQNSLDVKCIVDFVENIKK